MCLREQDPPPASMAPLSEARESSKAYKRSHKETINQIPNHHTWSFIGRAGPQARLGSSSSALPARPPSSPSPTEATSSPSHAGDVDQPTDQQGEYRAICLFRKLENRKKAEICNYCINLITIQGQGVVPGCCLGEINIFMADPHLPPQ